MQIIRDAQSYEIPLFTYAYGCKNLDIKYECMQKTGASCGQGLREAPDLYSGPDAYQMDTRSSFGRNIGSFSVTLNASYQASICGRAPFTRHSPSECTSILVR